MPADPAAQGRLLLLDREKFHGSFAADLPGGQAAFMADAQVPWGWTPWVDHHQSAWRTKPSWYLVAAEDRVIPPSAQRAMSEQAGSSVVRVPGSHAIYVPQPVALAALIEQAASALAPAYPTLSEGTSPSCAAR